MKQEQKTWDTGSVILWAQEYFSRKQIPQPRLSAELLLAHATGLSRTGLYTRWGEEVSAPSLSTFKEGLKQLVAGIPLAHITGHKNFMGWDFCVDQRVLIPRPETEELVEWVVQEYKGFSPVFFDLGTGSGVIAVCLARFFPGSQVLATDVSKPALEVARENARRLGVEKQVCFQEADFLDIPEEWLHQVDVVVCNPPYVAIDDAFLCAQVRENEPHLALFGGEDGLAFFRRIRENAPRLQGKTLFCEMGFDQKEALQTLFQEFSPTFQRDLFGNWRMVKICV